MAAWNEQRQEYARRSRLPFIPVLSDEQAPPADGELVRKMLAGELSAELWDRIAIYCWTYPTWIRVARQIEGERRERRRQLLEQAEPPTQS